MLEKLGEKPYVHDFFKNYLPLVDAAASEHVECVQIIYTYLKNSHLTDAELKKHVIRAYESCSNDKIREFLRSTLKPKYLQKLEAKDPHRIEIKETQKIVLPATQTPSENNKNTSASQELFKSEKITRYQRITFFDPNQNNAKCIAYIPEKQWDHMHKNHNEDFEKTMKLYSQIGISRRLVMLKNGLFKYRGRQDERYLLSEVPVANIPCKDVIDDPTARYFVCYEKDKHTKKAII